MQILKNFASFAGISDNLTKKYSFQPDNFLEILSGNIEHAGLLVSNIDRIKNIHQGCQTRNDIISWGYILIHQFHEGEYLKWLSRNVI